MPIPVPSPKFSAAFVDDEGVFQPAIGWKLYTYTAGTSTPRSTYTDITLGSANTNPVVLDARGEADVWLSGAYKLRLTNTLDELIWEVDEVKDITGSQTYTNATLAGTLTISSTAVTWSGNPTHSGNHIFSGNVTVNGNTRIGNAVSDTFTVETDTVTYTAGEVAHSGSNHTFSNDVTVDGVLSNTDGPVDSGTYTPTFTNVDNITTSTPDVSHWMRIGTEVIVFVRGEVTPTAALTTTTNLGISLPVASNLVAAADLNGLGNSPSAAAQTSQPRIFADTANNRANAIWGAQSTLAQIYVFSFMYKVI